METPVSNPGALKALIIVHMAMLSAQIIFGLVAFYLVYAMSFNEGLHFPDRTLQVMAIAFSAGGFYTGMVFFKRKLVQAREMQAHAKVKFELYRKACIMQWALIEGPCLFVIICFLLTGNYAFLALAAVLVLLFTMIAPSRLKVLTQLQLSEKEMKEL